MRADVLVIGAGPAGSTLACRLARAGFAVVLADRADFPRDKPCGEFLSPECAPYLAEFGLHDLPAQLGAVPVPGMRLSGFGCTAHGRFRQLPDRAAHGRSGFGLRRTVLDHALLQAAITAGAIFLPRHTFSALRRHGDRVTGAILRLPGGGERELAARCVVGADGVRSGVARALGVQRRLTWLDQIALVAHFAPAGDSPATPGAAADVGLVPGGFLATTDVDGGTASVNVVLPRALVRARSGGDWDGFLQQQLAAAPTVAARLAGQRRITAWRGCGPFGFTTTTPIAPGALLVGDAAGYVDPMTGEGIYFALFLAKVASAAVSKALHEPAQETAAFAAYAAARAREVGPRLAASRWLQHGIRHPWLVRSFLRGLARWPSLADLLVTLTGDTIHPRELLRPGFWRAWRTAS